MVKLYPVKDKTANKTQDYNIVSFSIYNTDHIDATANIRVSLERALNELQFHWYQMFMIRPKYGEVMSSERKNSK